MPLPMRPEPFGFKVPTLGCLYLAAVDELLERRLERGLGAQFRHSLVGPARGARDAAAQKLELSLQVSRWGSGWLHFAFSLPL